MKQWYKSEMFWATVIFVLFLMAIPFLINESYKDGNGYVTLWNAADALSFYGSVLSLIGTVVLGIIAIWQNKRANEINDRLLKLESLKKKEQIFDLYLQYVDKMNNVLNSIYLFGEKNEKNGSEIYLSIRECTNEGIRIRRKLRYYDKNNENDVFFEYSFNIAMEIMDMTYESDDQKRYETIRNYIIESQEQYIKATTEFLDRIYKSLYKEDTPNE